MTLHNPQIWKAVAFLFPAAQPLVDYEIRDDSNGLGPYIGAWHLASPIPPDQQLLDAIVSYDTQATQQAQDTAALRNKVLVLAQSAVGVAADQLTAGQLRALFAVTLWKEGALDKNFIVQPLAKWV